MNLSETITKGLTYTIDNTIACSNESQSIWLILLALIGLFSVISTIIQSGLRNMFMPVAYLIGIINFIIEKFKGNNIKKEKKKNKEKEVK